MVARFVALVLDVLVAAPVARASPITWYLSGVTVTNPTASPLTFVGNFSFDPSMPDNRSAISDVCIHATTDGGCGSEDVSVFAGSVNKFCNGCDQPSMSLYSVATTLYQGSYIPNGYLWITFAGPLAPGVTTGIDSVAFVYQSFSPLFSVLWACETGCAGAQVVPADVPEPTSFGLLILGLAGIGMSRCRRT